MSVQNVPTADRVEIGDEFGRLDTAIAVLMAAATVGVFLLIVAAFGDSLARLGLARQFLEADSDRIMIDMLDPTAVHWRLTVHPLFCLLTMPFAMTLNALGASRLQAVWICNSATAATAVSLFYVIQRLLGSARRPAVLVCLLALSSSAMLFWMTIPETYLLGSLSLLACFAVAAASSRGTISDLWLAIAGAFSLGVTITNWSAGIALAVFHRPVGKATVILAATIALTMVGWKIEKVAFPGLTGFFMKPEVISAEGKFLAYPEGALMGELIHPVVAPPEENAGETHGFRMLSFQRSSVLRGGSSTAAAAGWLIVLSAGMAALFQGPAPPRFRLMLGSVLAAQIVLHFIYGSETFLYALHFWVLLMLVAGLAVQADRRGVIQCVMAATILLTAWNNVHHLADAAKAPLDARACFFDVLDGPRK